MCFSNCGIELEMMKRLYRILKGAVGSERLERCIEVYSRCNFQIHGTDPIPDWPGSLHMRRLGRSGIGAIDFEIGRIQEGRDAAERRRKGQPTYMEPTRRQVEREQAKRVVEARLALIGEGRSGAESALVGILNEVQAYNRTVTDIKEVAASARAVARRQRALEKENEAYDDDVLRWFDETNREPWLEQVFRSDDVSSSQSASSGLASLSAMPGPPHHVITFYSSGQGDCQCLL